MLHACLYTICFVFCYTSWSFYAFSGTNLLTRRHSASSLFLLFLCFKKATQEIFSKLDETKAKVHICPKRHRVQSRDRGVPGGGRTAPWCGPPLGHAGGWCGPLVRPLTPPLSSYLKPSEAQTLDQSVFFEKEFCSSAAATDEFQGTEVSVPAPFRDEEVPPEPSPSTPSPLPLSPSTPLPPPSSPSTSPPSPSTLLSPMMRRE
jgi:hypothetical protein